MLRIIILSIVMLCSCNNKQGDKAKPLGSVTDTPKTETTSKENAPVMKQDCPVHGLAGVMLDNPESTESHGAGVIWDEIEKDAHEEDFPQAHFLNADKSQKISFTFFPGGIRNSISVFALSQPSKEDLKLPILPKLKQIKTDNGIFLGQSFAEVKKILSGVVGIEIADSDINFKVSSMTPQTSACLGQYNMPVYYLVINFDENKKLSFLEFGFEYP